MCFSRARSDLAWRDVVDVHDTNNVIFSIAASFEVRIQLVGQDLVHVGCEEGWVDTDLPLEVSQEKHRGGEMLISLLSKIESRRW